ncbi:putative dynein light chain Tctex-type 1 [Paratrimastix pyriformis]|uniref:Dynein light chain Tctex-type 1 n=1 Tax=Paratrimastix pyriformis TaxID=342808 RepID=A0ABQ8UPI8_9EUKA|nr:putative dynein light chain Tctex-type 1 [Paratrimastix pyriformis]
MDDLQSSEEAAFVHEDVRSIVKEVVESTLGPLPQGKPYSHESVPEWIDTICSGITKRLASLHKPFKYVVSSVIMQKNGAGLHTASSCFWDNATDGSVVHPFEGKFLYCVTTVLGIQV